MILKIDNGGERASKKCKPHLWFAWRPVRVSPTEIAWLERVVRIGKFQWMVRGRGRKDKRNWFFTYETASRTALQEKGERG